MSSLEPKNNTRLGQKKLLIATVLAEGSLMLIFFLWSHFKEVSIIGVPVVADLGYSILLCIPLLLLNFILFGPMSSKIELFRSCRFFKDKIAKPLADELSVSAALLVSLLAGFGEELFFRGVLQNEFGIVIASVAFAVLHFGPAILSFYFIGSLYILIGFYFGFIYSCSENLWTPIMVHATYDFIALLYLKYYDRPQS